MKITVGQPYAFSEIGRKDNQEDALYPAAFPDGDGLLAGKQGQRVFLLCDGMGGHGHGEVASQTVVEAMGRVLDRALDPRSAFDQALSEAYDQLDAKDVYADLKKMGTTMTCLIIDDNGALVAHMGDSRVYQVRPSTGVLFQTSDHSLVNELLKAGELTEEDAINYPYRNLITRAMQPHRERRSKVELNQLSDIRRGDYFFLCSDGMLEQLSNQQLCEILASPTSDREKIAAIKAICDGMTRDNYTCWLVPIADAEGTSESTF